MSRHLPTRSPEIMGLDEAGSRTRERIALGVTIAGAIALVGGLVCYLRLRGRAGLDGLGRLEKEVKAGGMTVRHHRGSMPIKKRIGHLQDLVYASVHDPRMRKIALEVTRGCPERDGECEARAIYNTMKRRIRYSGDVAPIKHGKDGPVEGIDLYQSAWRTWEFGAGDCDDHSVLAATLLALNGITPKFRVTAPRKDAEFSHIYTMAGLPKMRPEKWVALDTTLPGDRFGVEVPFGRNADFPA